MREEIKNIADNLVKNAQYDYIRSRIVDLLARPEPFIKDRVMAVYVCDMLINALLNEGAIEKDDLVHRLGLSLMKYIRQEN
jgi:hypothetical protein